MQAKELRTKSKDELQKELENLKKELEKRMLEIYKGKEKNVVKTRFLRRDLARINTILSEKKFMGETENA